MSKRGEGIFLVSKLLPSNIEVAVNLFNRQGCIRKRQDWGGEYVNEEQLKLKRCYLREGYGGAVQGTGQAAKAAKAEQK